MIMCTGAKLVKEFEIVLCTEIPLFSKNNSIYFNIFKCNSIGPVLPLIVRDVNWKVWRASVLAVRLLSFVSELGEPAFLPSLPPRFCFGDVLTDLQCFLVCMVTDVYVNNRLFYEGIHFIAKY